jgi:hypothetical protein
MHCELKKIGQEAVLAYFKVGYLRTALLQLGFEPRTSWMRVLL